METTTTWLIGAGGLWVSISFFLGVVELVLLPTIRPPKRQTFSYIRLASMQYQTVFAPAIGALISGLFVSVAASFFYASFTGQKDSSNQVAGIVTFLAGATALAVTLFSVLKVGEPAELARDPFSIRAAADESAAAPRSGGLDPDVLTQQLDEWEKYISARSMNLSVKGTSGGLQENLTRAAQARGFRISAWGALRIYYSALLRFPFRFVWPLLGFPLLMVGIVWHVMTGPAALSFATSWRPWATVGLSAIFSAMPILFYCVTRGSRARLWHRINLVALRDARNAIGEAKSAQASVAAEDALLRRILTNADKFLQHNPAAQDKAVRTVLRLGRFRISKL